MVDNLHGVFIHIYMAEDRGHCSDKIIVLSNKKDSDTMKSFLRAKESDLEPKCRISGRDNSLILLFAINVMLCHCPFQS